MRKGKSVTKSLLDAAAMDVQSELVQIGLWNKSSRLTQTEVYWCRLPQFTMPDALGFFVHDTHALGQLLGYDPGHIYIPAWVLSQGLWQDRGSLRNVLRHEYGHAVAHYYPALTQRSSRFRVVFGGRYEAKEREKEAKPGEFVSEYAASCPAEDFAETFMFYVRLGGQIPQHFSGALPRKWRFIRDVCRVIQSGKAGW